MIASQAPYGYVQPGQPLAPGQPLVPGQPLPGQPLGASFVGGQQFYYPPGTSQHTGTIALLLFFASVVFNVYSGVWGAGNFEWKACPSRSTAHAIILAIYAFFGLSLFYAVFTRTWSEESYHWSIAASVLNTLSVILKVWWHHSKSPILHLLGSYPVQLLVLLALVVVLYNLWWSLYRPYDDWASIAARNSVAFYLGWILFAAVKSFWLLLGNLLGWKGAGNRVLFWALELFAFVTVFALIYRLIYFNGLQAFSGFFLAGLWVFIACVAV